MTIIKTLQITIIKSLKKTKKIVIKKLLLSLLLLSSSLLFIITSNLRLLKCFRQSAGQGHEIGESGKKETFESVAFREANDSCSYCLG